MIKQQEQFELKEAAMALEQARLLQITRVQEEQQNQMDEKLLIEE